MGDCLLKEGTLRLGEVSGAPGPHQRAAQRLILRALWSLTVPQRVSGGRSILVEQVGGLEAPPVARGAMRHQSRDERNRQVGGQQARAVALAQLNEQEAVGRQLPATLQLIEADAQGLPLRSRRLRHAPA
jgi:hypothetical protein